MSWLAAAEGIGVRFFRRNAQPAEALSWFSRRHGSSSYRYTVDIVAVVQRLGQGVANAQMGVQFSLATQWEEAAEKSV